jgi:hypothetical protein
MHFTYRKAKTQNIGWEIMANTNHTDNYSVGLETSMSTTTEIRRIGWSRSTLKDSSGLENAKLRFHDRIAVF